MWLLGGPCVVGPVGGMHGCCGGACVVVWGGAWLFRGVCVVGPGGMRGFSRGGACVGYDEIRSISGRYASYWNAFLFTFVYPFFKVYANL